MFQLVLKRCTLLIIVVVGGVILSVTPPRVAHAATSITINGGSSGRVFDGIGAISGGGGNSRYLPDYREPQRSQILDYLFKPDYGASVHILKVEIGGDTNSTDGSEASHMHTANQTPNCNSGYEFWLMKQARNRNPNIKLYGLAWGAPGWIGGGNFWSQDMINYLIAFLNCARSNGTPINYLGGWNERGHDKTWYENLKSTLNSRGFSSVQVVGDDTNWGTADDMVSDPAFNAAVDIVGAHYPCTGGDGGSADSCPSTANAIATGKPLWASENGSQDYNSGSIAMAKAINRGYIDGKMTAFINWPIISSMPQELPFEGDGLMYAPQPWSGYYAVGKQLWVEAHTTQFAQPGWRYLDSGSGYLGGNRSNGSYVTLKSPNGSDYSTVIETVDASSAQDFNVTVTGGLSSGPVHVWATNLKSSNSADWFDHVTDVSPDSSGSYTVTLQPGYIYTLSTTTGQSKGTASSATSGNFPLPYSDNFDGDTVGTLPRYLADQTGAFEVVNCGGGRGGQCIRQMAPIHAIDWVTNYTPYTTIGDDSLTDYTISSDVLLETPGSSVEIIGRATALGGYGSVPDAYYLRATDTGAWQIIRGDGNGKYTTLTQGQVGAWGTNTWHKLSLTLQSSSLIASIDGNQVGSVQDSRYSYGMAGLATGVTDGIWETAQFDNLSLTGLSSGTTSIDDSIQGNGLNQFNYVGTGWGHCSGCGNDLYSGTNSWDNVTNDDVTLSFNGTRIKFYGVVDPQHGIGAVSIDGGKESNIDFYAATRAGDQLLWTSPILHRGRHTFKLRVTGKKNPSSSNTFVAVDRVGII